MNTSRLITFGPLQRRLCAVPSVAAVAMAVGIMRHRLRVARERD